MASATLPGTRWQPRLGWSACFAASLHRVLDCFAASLLRCLTASPAAWLLRLRRCFGAPQAPPVPQQLQKLDQRANQLVGLGCCSAGAEGGTASAALPRPGFACSAARSPHWSGLAAAPVPQLDHLASQAWLLHRVRLRGSSNLRAGEALQRDGKAARVTLEQLS